MISHITLGKTSPTVVTAVVAVNMWSGNPEADHAEAVAMWDAIERDVPVIATEIKRVRKLAFDPFGQFETNAMAMIFANEMLADEALDWIDHYTDEPE